MEVVCVDNSKENFCEKGELTLGKYYEVHENLKGGDCYYVTNNFGYVVGYYKRRFRTKK
jgi:hypothetical protein